MTLAYLIGLAYLLERISLVITGFNYGSRYNGLGAVDDTLARRGDAPMVYRVLAPWAMAGLQRLGMRKLEAYELAKVALNFFALWAVTQAWSFEAALIVAVLLPVTFLYDYWDWAVELGAIALGMTGRIELAIVGVSLLALSRETFPLVGAAYYCSVPDSLGALLVTAAGGSVWLLVRMIQGKHELYCQRVMLVENLRTLRLMRLKRPLLLNDVSMSLVVIGLGVWAAAQGGAGWPVPLAVIGLGMTFGRIEETRIFAGVLPFVAGRLM